MDDVLMNSKTGGTSDPHKLLLNFTGKTNSRKSDRYVALSNNSIYYTQENTKKSYKK